MKLIALSMLAVTLASCTSDQQPEQASSHPLVGTWELDSWIATLPGGESLLPFGSDASGRISYDASGRVAVQIMKQGRPHFSDGDIMGGSADEVSAAYHGFLAYLGSYELNESTGQVTHFLEVSSFPNWEGSEQVRSYSLSGDTLRLSPPAIESVATQSASAEHVLTWIRK
jgi:hypothetical protein